MLKHRLIYSVNCSNVQFPKHILIYSVNCSNVICILFISEIRRNQEKSRKWKSLMTYNYSIGTRAAHASTRCAFQFIPYHENYVSLKSHFTHSTRWAIKLTLCGCDLIEHIPLYLTFVAAGNSVEIFPLNTALPPGLCTNSAVDLPPNWSSVISVHCSRVSLFLKSHKTSEYLKFAIGSGNRVFTTVFTAGFWKKPLTPLIIPPPDAMLIPSPFCCNGLPRRRLVTKKCQDGGCLQRLQETPPECSHKKMSWSQLFHIEIKIYYSCCLYL